MRAEVYANLVASPIHIYRNETETRCARPLMRRSLSRAPKDTTRLSELKPTPHTHNTTHQISSEDKGGQGYMEKL